MKNIERILCLYLDDETKILYIELDTSERECLFMLRNPTKELAKFMAKLEKQEHK